MLYTTIFHIDDDDDDLDFFMEAAGGISASARLFSFSGAAEALRVIAAGEMIPDAVFLDLNMPVMNGQEFLSKLAACGIGKSIKIIILSTSADPATISSLKNLYDVDFLSKPSGIKELAELLRPYLT